MFRSTSKKFLKYEKKLASLAGANFCRKGMPGASGRKACFAPYVRRRRTRERRGRASAHQRCACGNPGEACGASERPARFEWVLAVYSARTQEVVASGGQERNRFWNLISDFYYFTWPPEAARKALAGHRGPAREEAERSQIPLREIWRSLWEKSREDTLFREGFALSEFKVIYLLCILPLTTKSRQRATPKEVNWFK